MNKIREFIGEHKYWIMAVVAAVGVLFLIVRNRRASDSSGSAGATRNVGGFGGVQLGAPIGTGNTTPQVNPDNSPHDYPGGQTTSNEDTAPDESATESPADGSTQPDPALLADPTDGDKPPPRLVPITEPTPDAVQSNDDSDDAPTPAPNFARDSSGDLIKLSGTKSGEARRATKHEQHVTQSKLPDYKKRQLLRGDKRPGSITGL